MKKPRLPNALRASILSWCILIFGAVITTTASAIPALQLGPDSGDPGWSYDASTQTWVYNGGSSLDLVAYANATAADGGNGDYAWNALGATDQFAYLVVAAVPDLGDIDAFDITVSGALLVDTGYGAPPIQDTNSLAPHGIFDTYFEIYEFQFNGPFTQISDTQPGQTGTGVGYTETIGIDINSILDGLTGIHFDLFTISGDGIFDPFDTSQDKNLVEAFAPFSHDAQVTTGEPPAAVPVPAAVWLFGSGLIGLVGISRRKKSV